MGLEGDGSLSCRATPLVEDTGGAGLDWLRAEIDCACACDCDASIFFAFFSTARCSRLRLMISWRSTAEKA